LYKLLNFKEHRDSRGALTSFESAHEIPFGIQRMYVIYDTQQDISRGFHAHKTLQQVLVCIKGSCEIKLDNGVKNEVVNLNSPLVGIYIKDHIWREMHNFSDDCILVVFADQYFHEQDYIRDYNEFLKAISDDS